MGTHNYKCSFDEKNLLILHTDYPDGVGIELYSDKDDIALSDEDALDLAYKIIDYFEYKAKREEKENEKTSFERMQEESEIALDQAADWKLEEMQLARHEEG